MRHIIAVLMENEAGALSRVVGLFSQRNFNIETLNVAPTEDPTLSRLTVTTSGSDRVIEQITKQLNKLIEVVKLVDLTDGDHIEREMMLIKLKAAGQHRDEIKRTVDIFRGQIVDVTSSVYTVQLTGDQGKLDAFINAIGETYVLETVRSGVSGIARGEKVLSIQSYMCRYMKTQPKGCVFYLQDVMYVAVAWMPKNDVARGKVQIAMLEFHLYPQYWIVYMSQIDSKSETDVEVDEVTSSVPAKKPAKGVYLLPNSFTTASLFAGFYAIVAAMNGDFEYAAIATFVSMVLDGLDGRVARMTNTQSDFGAEYDSLADVVAFGVAPALVVFTWGVQTLGKFGWIAAFIYVAGAALRLARFNVQLEVSDSRYFTGLPSPAAAGVLAGMIWASQEYGFSGVEYALPAAILVAVTGILMVSNFCYYSFKDLRFKGRVPFFALLIVVLVYALIAMEPPAVLWLFFLVFALSGPVGWLFKWKRS